MTELLIHLFTGFWSCLFFGWLFFVLFFISLHSFEMCWNRFWRYWNIRKHGWPPHHCDVDGDIIRTINKEETE